MTMPIKRKKGNDWQEKSNEGKDFLALAEAYKSRTPQRKKDTVH